MICMSLNFQPLSYKSCSPPLDLCRWTDNVILRLEKRVQVKVILPANLLANEKKHRNVILKIVDSDKM